MDEDERIEKILAVKAALEEIEKAISKGDEDLAIILENKIGDNQYMVKNTTWNDCIAGICSVDWVLR